MKQIHGNGGCPRKKNRYHSICRHAIDVDPCYDRNKTDEEHGKTLCLGLDENSRYEADDSDDDGLFLTDALNDCAAK